MSFFILKTFKKSFSETIDFVENLEVTQIAAGVGHILCVIMMQCVRKLICHSLFLEGFSQECFKLKFPGIFSQTDVLKVLMKTEDTFSIETFYQRSSTGAFLK